MLDARDEKVREDGGLRSRAIWMAIGLNWDGRREVLAVEWANRESATTRKVFLQQLRARGLRGVEFVVSDDHLGLKRAIQVLHPEAAWQCCYMHFLRNVLDCLSPRIHDDCLTELRWLYDRHNLEEARRDLVVWLRMWQDLHFKLCTWVEKNIEETFSFYRLPAAHCKRRLNTTAGGVRAARRGRRRGVRRR